MKIKKGKLENRKRQGSFTKLGDTQPAKEGSLVQIWDLLTVETGKGGLEGGGRRRVARGGGREWKRIAGGVKSKKKNFWGQK